MNDGFAAHFSSFSDEEQDKHPGCRGGSEEVIVGYNTGIDYIDQDFYVVDKPAWTETIYVCSCGARKQKGKQI